MAIIISDNIEKECLNLISIYQDIDFIKNKILKAYSNLSKDKQISVSENIRFYINQGLELYSVSNTSINTIPLTLFYSLNNFAKAIYLLYYPNLSISGSHGLTLAEAKTVSSIGDTIVHINKKGTFVNLNDVIGDPLFPNDAISLKELFSLLPELREIYYLIYEEEPNVFLLQGKKESDSFYNVFFQTTKEEFITCKDLTLLKTNGYHLNTFNSYYGLQGELSLTTDGFGKENNVLYYDIFGNKYCTTGIKIANSYVKLSKLNILYICLYVFSMYVRYYPDMWMKYCASKDNSIINKLVTNSKTTLLTEILQLLNQEHYSFTRKVELLENDLDYSDILKNLLKKIDEENHRRGKSILLEYI